MRTYTDVHQILFAPGALMAADLQMFAANPQGTDSSGLSAEMKTYYSDYLIDNAEPLLIHAQFGQKRNIPRHGGKTVEFRKYTPLAKITGALTEGVTPDGQNLNVTTLESSVKQIGGYVTLTDLILATAIDNNMVEATELLGEQAGRSVDTLIRDILNGGTNVQYADGSVSARNLLVGGAASGNHYLTVDCIRRAVRFLKAQNAKKINGDYIGIIHPDCTYDLTSDPDWKYPHQYQDTKELYDGEIGKVAGVRFVETTEAKIFAGEGKDGRDVYSTLIIAKDAYGVTEIEGEGLEHIVKQLGSGGTADPLDQRATAGWKYTGTATRLVEQFMVRIETASTFASGEN